MDWQIKDFFCVQQGKGRYDMIRAYVPKQSTSTDVGALYYGYLLKQKCCWIGESRFRMLVRSFS